MIEPPSPGRHARIDAAAVNSADISHDGSRLRLQVLDQDGRPALVSLPVDCINTVLRALPNAARDAGGAVHRLECWSLRENEGGLLLTLGRPDGTGITFAVQTWQIAAIASLAGLDRGAGRTRLN
jgi:hypothetical protein